MLVRCEKHPSKPYHYTANPVGYPRTAAVYGRCVCLMKLNGDNTKQAKLCSVLTATS